MFKKLLLFIILLLGNDLLAQSFTLKDSLVVFFPFTQNSRDSSGNNHHSQVYGAVYSTDRFGNPNSALWFDGVDDSVIVGNVLNVPQQKAISYSAWFRPESINWPNPNNRHVGLAIGRKSSGELAMNVDDESTKRFSARIYQGSQQSINSNASYCRSEPNSLKYSQWFHVVAVFEDTVVTLYVDAWKRDQFCTQTNNGGRFSYVPSQAILRIGKGFNSYETERNFHGKIDDVRIYNRALNYCEVVKLFGDSSLIVRASPDTSICKGQTVDLNALGGQNLKWDTGDTTHKITVAPSSSTWYYLQDTIRGCTDSVQVRVMDPSSLKDTSICQGDFVTLKAPCGDALSWSNGQFGSTITVSPLTTTTYVYQDTLTGFMDSVMVTVYPIPKAVFSADPISGSAPLLVTFLNGSMGASSYEWILSNGMIFSQKDLTYTFPSGNYEVILVAFNEFGCTDTAAVTITVQDDFGIQIPNTFSPNFDGVNDQWEVEILGMTSSVKCEVFNRWGGKMYGSEEREIRWDGYFHGHPAAEGVYFYYIELVLSIGENKIYKGTIHLFH